MAREVETLDEKNIATYRFESVIRPDEIVTLFILDVTCNKSKWRILRRYREFDALRLVVEQHIDGSSRLPPFPPKSIHATTTPVVLASVDTCRIALIIRFRPRYR